MVAERREGLCPAMGHTTGWIKKNAIVTIKML